MSRYPPAKQRRNLVVNACYHYVRDHWPGIYQRIKRSAETNVPKLPAGRRKKPPTVIVPVPVLEFKRPMKMLRPMKRKA